MPALGLQPLAEEWQNEATALAHYFPAVFNIANIGFSCVEVLPVATGKILVAILAWQQWDLMSRKW